MPAGYEVIFIRKLAKIFHKPALYPAEKNILPFAESYEDIPLY